MGVTPYGSHKYWLEFFLLTTDKGGNTVVDHDTILLDSVGMSGLL